MGILMIVADIIIFTVVVFILSVFKDKISEYSENIDLERWLPIEQMKEFKQLFYLIIAGLLIVDLYYLIVLNTYFNYMWNLVIFDFIISIVAAIYIFDKNNLLKTIILLITLIPFTGYTFTGYYGLDVVSFIILEIIHIMGILYIIYLAFTEFKSYSESHKLGYTILLLYIVVTISVFLSTRFQNLGLLDSLVYCSNAFTSNGYGLVNATNVGGKIISLILVWSGYILSGVTTAILTLALLSRYYNNKINIIEEKAIKTEKELNDLNKKLDLLLEDK